MEKKILGISRAKFHDWLFSLIFLEIEFSKMAYLIKTAFPIIFVVIITIIFMIIFDNIICDKI